MNLAKKGRILSGHRPTGLLHIGHYEGTLRNWVSMQDDYECFFEIADWHALTTGYDETETMPERIEQTARLHAALRDYDGGELRFWAPFGHIPDGLAALQDRDDLLPTSDLARAQREWAVIAPVIETLRTTPELCEL